MVEIIKNADKNPDITGETGKELWDLNNSEIKNMTMNSPKERFLWPEGQKQLSDVIKKFAEWCSTYVNSDNTNQHAYEELKKTLHPEIAKKYSFPSDNFEERWPRTQHTYLLNTIKKIITDQLPELAKNINSNDGFNTIYYKTSEYKKNLDKKSNT